MNGLSRSGGPARWIVTCPVASSIVASTLTLLPVMGSEYGRALERPVSGFRWAFFKWNGHAVYFRAQNAHGRWARFARGNGSTTVTRCAGAVAVGRFSNVSLVAHPSVRRHVVLGAGALWADEIVGVVGRDAERDAGLLLSHFGCRGRRVL